MHVEFKGKKKNYVLTSEKLILEIDLRQLLILYEKRKDFEIKELELLAYRYFEEKIRKDKLPMTITVKYVASVLGIDTNTAIGVVDFINTYTERFIDLLDL